jgi:hypothetical protein
VSSCDAPRFGSDDGGLTGVGVAAACTGGEATDVAVVLGAGGVGAGAGVGAGEGFGGVGVGFDVGGAVGDGVERGGNDDEAVVWEVISVAGP